jgi:Uma2 family endonuclease
MAAEVVTNDALPMVPAELCPDVDHLVTEDDAPVDNVYSEKQQRLLTEPLYSSWSGPGAGRSCVAMANVGVFYSPRRPPLVPDMLLSLDVELPEDLWPKAHRSYFTWLYEKPPDVVVEVVWNREGGEESAKLAIYARIGVRYYVIFDPERLLGPEALRAYRLEALTFHKMDQPVWFPDVGLGLQIWHGRYEDHENTWLRWQDREGRVIPSGKERAERLAEQLRRLGVEPQA